MSGSKFIPSTNRAVPPDPTVSTASSNEEYRDTQGLTGMLLQVAQYALVAMVFLLPLFFVPQLFGTLGFGKVLMTFTLAVVAVITLSFVGLRRRYMSTVLPYPLAIYGVLILVALASALLSGDSLDAIRGSTFETQTVSFLALMGLVMTLPLMLQQAKGQSMKVLVGFASAAGLLMLYVVLRMAFGASFLDFNSFANVTVSPIGNLNDLGLLAGMVVIASLITLAQLPIRGWLQYLIAALVVLALGLLCVINFFNVWIILGFIGLLLFMYLVTRDTLFASETADTEQTPVSRVLIVLTLLVSLVSAFFIVSGGQLGAKVGEYTGIDYVEVRPSFSATTDVMQAVYSENALLGIGPNRFADAWRLYRDGSINQTIFWDTDFNAGSGFVSTLFVNTGVLGGLLLVVFHAWFLFTGARMLLRVEKPDRFWYYFGLVSFSLAVFVWLISYVYVPGPAILLLGAFFTGCTFAASGSLVPSLRHRIGLAVNQRRGFIMMSATIIVITGSIAALYAVGEQYVAQASFNEAQVTATDIAQFESAAQQSYELFPDDRFLLARAQVQLATLNGLLNVAEPGDAEEQQFLQVAPAAIELASAAVQADNTNPDNHAVLASIYVALGAAGVNDTGERATAALNEAKRYDPLNPVYYLIDARLALQNDDSDAARSSLTEALNLKRNFTEALFLASQIDINEGNIESAIATTQAIITLEPNNPTRYYQLGILLAANQQPEEAILAHERALALDPEYANARYMLALQYLGVGREDDALTELRRVAETNQDNQQLQAIIAQVEAGDYEVATGDTMTDTIAETADVETLDEAVVTDGEVDTDLVSPVNTVSDDATTTAEDETAAAPETAEVPAADSPDTDENPEAAQ